MALTTKQEAFAQHYALTCNATESYEKAGYSTRAKKRETIHRKAVEVLQNGSVSARIAELQQRVRKDAEDKFELTVERLTEAYMDIAFADPADLYTWSADGDMTLKTPDQLTPRQRRLLAHMQKTSGKSVSIEFRLNDRMKALDALAKRLGFFEVDNAQNAGVVNITISQDDAEL